jgi:hypothetical protein
MIFGNNAVWLSLENRTGCGGEYLDIPRYERKKTVEK